VLDTEDSRRAGFVDMLLDMETHNTLPHQRRDAPDGSVLIDSRHEENNSIYEKKETNHGGISFNKVIVIPVFILNYFSE
jgi:ATP-dependent RNA helicase DHX29